MSSRSVRSGFVFAVVQMMALASAAAQVSKGPVRLLGRIVSVVHEAVPAAEVWVTDDSGKTLARTTADGDGYYQLHRLPSVAMQLHARGADKVEGCMPVAANGLVRAMTMSLEDGDPLRGTVLAADGTPLAGASVLVAPATRLPPPYDWWEETTTAADGSWSLAVVPLRALVVVAFVPGLAMGEATVDEDRAGDVVVKVPAGPAAARTVTVHGVPPGATAVVWSDLGPVHLARKRLPGASLEAIVGADGTAKLWALPVKHEVRVRLAGHSSQPVYIPSAAGEARDLEFAMSALPADLVAPKTRLVGRVVDSVGTALPGVTILGKLDDVHGEPVTSGADGGFQLSVPVRAGVLYRLAITSPGWRLGGDRVVLDTDGLCWSTLAVDPTVPLELRVLPTGIARGVLKGPNGAPMAAADLHVQRSPDPAVPGARAGGAMEVQPCVVRAASDAAGRVELSGMPSGTYRLRASGPGMPPGEVEFTVGPSGTTTIGALTFGPVGEVVGVVTGRGGAPKASTTLLLFDAKPQRLPLPLRAQLMNLSGTDGFVLTDRHGRYRVPALAVGKWALDDWTGPDRRQQARNPTAFTVEAGGTVTCDLAVSR